MKTAMHGAPVAAVVLFGVIATTCVVVVSVVAELRPRAVLADCGLFPASVSLRRGVAGALAYVALGVVLAVLSWELATRVTTPLFPRPAGLVDDRGDGYSAADPLRGAVGQFVENGLSEELIFRTPLALWAVMIAPAIPHRRLRWLAGLVVVVVTALAFAASHSEYGMWNMSSAAVSGLLFGAATLTTRSLWPAVIGHTLYDTAVLVV